MKYLTLLIVTLIMSGCMLLPECDPGDQEICECGPTMSYKNQCTMDGEYLDCQCYDNGGNGSTVIEVHPTRGGTMSGGDQYLLNGEYALLPEHTCNDDEVALPGTTACIRKCPVGMDYLDGRCQGYHYTQTYEHVLNKCREHDPRYRIISTSELKKLLVQCYPDTFWTSSVNYCSPYLTSPIRYALQFPNTYNTFSSWVGELVVCDDAYGNIAPNCAWDATFALTTQIDTTISLFRASAQYGSAMSSAICVRD